MSAISCEPHRHSSVCEGFVSVAVEQHPEPKSQMMLSLHSLCVGIQILHQGLQEVEWFNHSHTWEKLICTGSLSLPMTKWSRQIRCREQLRCSKMCHRLCRKSLLCHRDRGVVLRRCMPTFLQAELEKPVPIRMQGKSCRHSRCELSGDTAWDEPGEFPSATGRSQATLCLVQWGSAGWLLTKVSELPWHTPNIPSAGGLFLPLLSWDLQERLLGSNTKCQR